MPIGFISAVFSCRHCEHFPRTLASLCVLNYNNLLKQTRYKLTDWGGGWVPRYFYGPLVFQFLPQGATCSAIFKHTNKTSPHISLPLWMGMPCPHIIHHPSDHGDTDPLLLLSTERRLQWIQCSRVLFTCCRWWSSSVVQCPPGSLPAQRRYSVASDRWTTYRPPSTFLSSPADQRH